MTALEKFKGRIKRGFHVCIGLDSEISKIPSHLLSRKDPVLEFNKAIIDSTCDYASAYKINFAFYERDGSYGAELLAKTIEYIPKDILIIGDAKRGDIGNTSQLYAKSLFEYYNCDASTLNPYMGFDSISPFIDYEDKLNFVLALTSNTSAADFEKLKLYSGEFLFQNVISRVKDWNTKKNLGIVFGATKCDELKENIRLFGDLPVLLPGIGAQGGSLEDVVNTFKAEGKDLFIINISRGLIYLDDSISFAAKAKNELVKYNEMIIFLMS